LLQRLQQRQERPRRRCRILCLPRQFGFEQGLELLRRLIGIPLQSTWPLAASISIPAKRSSSVGSQAKGMTVCGHTRTCSG
jgi:hypothetical protein